VTAGDVRGRPRAAGRSGQDAEGSDAVQQLAAVANRGSTELPEIVRRKTGQHRSADVTLAECRRVLAKTQRAQPIRDVQTFTGGLTSQISGAGGAILSCQRPAQTGGKGFVAFSRLAA
jgi:hypothetical protein